MRIGSAVTKRTQQRIRKLFLIQQMTENSRNEKNLESASATNINLAFLRLNTSYNQEDETISMRMENERKIDACKRQDP